MSKKTFLELKAGDVIYDFGVILVVLEDVQTNDERYAKFTYIEQGEIHKLSNANISAWQDWLTIPDIIVISV